MDKKIRLIIAVFAVIAFLAILFFPLGIEPLQQVVLAVLFLAMILWFSELVPLHITAFIAAFLLIVVGGFFGGKEVFTPKEVFSPFFDPVIMLLLGGFILALGLQKHELDKLMTFVLLKKASSKPKNFLFGLMCLTAFLSFWMSNTASTAILLPIAMVVLASNKLKPLDSNFGKALVLGIAFAATIGGIGTVIGSPPNAMALSYLNQEGIAFGFTDWLKFGLPLVVLLLPIAWFVLNKLFPPEIHLIESNFSFQPLNKKQQLVLLIFGLTVLFWLTTGFHKIETSVVALIPVILLYAFGLLETKDINKVSWSSLILFGGGLTLGHAIQTVGLDKLFADILFQYLLGQPFLLIIVILAVFAIIFTVVASNTAAAAISIPLVIPLAKGLGVPVEIAVMIIAIGVSLDFIVPIGTPPSAIAYSSGYIKTSDMAKPGIIIALAGVILLTFLAFFVWPLFA
ncbi:DASS family sodium-coupled anion symporter [Candidatus Micrarchaeota archaeon]|nr:DASS family sodium-coupled anion symporter [Candidatus Micrarchaeota archaeon]MBU2477244.1 DASS family sodium-coupled anion symporter [Candidatus Micrarchaeota archaeon]